MTASNQEIREEQGPGKLKTQDIGKTAAERPSVSLEDSGLANPVPSGSDDTVRRIAAARYVSEDLSLLIRYSALIRRKTDIYNDPRAEDYDPKDDDGVSISEEFTQYMNRHLDREFTEGGVGDVDKSLRSRLEKSILFRWNRLHYRLRRAAALKIVQVESAASRPAEKPASPCEIPSEVSVSGHLVSRSKEQKMRKPSTDRSATILSPSTIDLAARKNRGPGSVSSAMGQSPLRFAIPVGERHSNCHEAMCPYCQTPQQFSYSSERSLRDEWK